MTRGRVIALAVMAIALVVVGITAIRNIAQQQFSPAPATSPAPTVTADEYGRIHDGMTLAQVQAVIGWQGKVMSATSSGVASSLEVEWQDSTTLRTIFVGFLNDVVSAKSEYGL